MHGRWIDTIGKLTPRGQAGPTEAHLPDGTRVIARDAGNGSTRYRVVRSGRIVDGLTRFAAATDSLDRSARGTQESSLGGTTRYRDARDYQQQAHGHFEPVRTTQHTDLHATSLEATANRAAQDPSEYVRRGEAATRAAAARKRETLRRMQGQTAHSSPGTDPAAHAAVNPPAPSVPGTTLTPAFGTRHPDAVEAVRQVGREQGITIEQEQHDYPYRGFTRITFAEPPRLRVASSRFVDIDERGGITPMISGGGRRTYTADQFRTHAAAAPAADAHLTPETRLELAQRPIENALGAQEASDAHLSARGQLLVRTGNGPREQEIIAAEMARRRDPNAPRYDRQRTPTSFETAMRGAEAFLNSPSPTEEQRTAVINALERAQTARTSSDTGGSQAGRVRAMLQNVRAHQSGARSAGAADQARANAASQGVQRAGEVTVQGIYGGRHVTLHLRPAPVERNNRPRYFTRDPVGQIQTRTGRNRYPHHLEFVHSHAEGEASAMPGDVLIDGQVYRMRREAVARNRPARVVGVGPDAGPFADRAEVHAAYREPLRVVGSDPSVPRPVTTPAPVPGSPAAAAATIADRLQQPAVRRQFQQHLGTKLEAAQMHAGILYLRGQDGRSWSLDPLQISRGRLNDQTVQVRTQTGVPHTAPSMRGFLHAVFDHPVEGTTTSQTIDRVHGIVPHGRPPERSPAAPSESRRGPSPSIAPPQAQTRAGTAPVVSGNSPQAVSVRNIVEKLHGFTYGGMTTKLNAASQHGFSGVVLDENGRQVGSFSREVRSDSVYHALFQIQGRARSTGFGTKFIEASFDAYASQGIKHVDVSAGLDAGGYQWAKMGFEFKDRDKVRAAQDAVSYNRIKLRAAVQAGHIPQALLDEFLRQLESGMLTSPSQIAAWGRNTTWTDRRADKEHTLWLGKEALLGAGWSGRKKLTDRPTFRERAG